MLARHTVDDVIETASLSKPVLRIIGLCFLLMICDSYDVGAIAYAAPVLIKDWHLTSASMGLVFGAGLFGLLLGSILLGRAGDMVGRKRAIIVGAFFFSILTIATAWAHNYEQLMILRFLAALGLGGAVPNAVALTGEFAPKSFRATAVGLIFAGYSIGGILAGVTAAMIVPIWGWPLLFLLGGGISLATTIALAVLLPESLAFLASKPGREAEALRVARTLRADMTFSPNLPIAAALTATRSRNGFRQLFVGELAIVTPLLWSIYIASSLTVFSLASWMPVAVEALGLPRASAASATALLFAGSAVGGILGGRLVDRFGLSAVIVFALAAFPTVWALGSLAHGTSSVFLISFLAGCTAFGTQTCLHGTVGSFYPAADRANGVGWAIGIAKIGSILGPILGGLLIAKLDSSALFLAAATPMIVVSILAVLLHMAPGRSAQAWRAKVG